MIEYDLEGRADGRVQSALASKVRCRRLLSPIVFDHLFTTEAWVVPEVRGICTWILRNTVS